MTLGTADEQRPESLQGYVQRRIKAAIAGGTIEPGSKLSPQLLSTEMGLSHIPIREALASLAAAGYIDYIQGKGYSARALSPADLDDIYHLRRVLEREAYAMAVPKITEEDIGEMQDLMKVMSNLTRKKDRPEYVQLSRELHFVVFRRAGSERLLRFLNDLWDAAAPYNIRTEAVLETAGLAKLSLSDSSAQHADHVELLQLLEARDVDSVIIAMDKHRGQGGAEVATPKTRSSAGSKRSAPRARASSPANSKPSANASTSKPRAR